VRRTRLPEYLSLGDDFDQPVQQQRRDGINAVTVLEAEGGRQQPSRALRPQQGEGAGVRQPTFEPPGQHLVAGRVSRTW